MLGVNAGHYARAEAVTHDDVSATGVGEPGLAAGFPPDGVDDLVSEAAH